MNMFEIRQYTDDEGKLITARISVNEITLEPVEHTSDIKNKKVARFFGTYTVPHPQIGPVRMEFEFPEGWDIKKCFEEFENEAKKNFTMIQAEAQKKSASKLWTPGGNNNDGKGLLVP